MKKLLAWAAALAVGAFSFVPIAYSDWSTKDMNDQIDQTNFLVNGNCSGTLIDLKNRLVLTAGHCVDSQYETVTVEEVDDKGVVTKKQVRRLIPGAVRQILFADSLEVRETTYRTNLKGVNKSLDLALLQIVSDIPNTVAAKVACIEPVRGDKVFMVGNSMSTLYSSVTAGIVSSTQRSYELLRFGDNSSQQKPLMQISNGIVGGNSGGAVYNTDGELIGVPVVAHRANEVIGFAVPLSSIKTFLKAQKVDLAVCDEKQ